MEAKKRVPATVVDIFYGIEDHGIWTCYVTLNCNGYTQSFGGLYLDKDKKGPDFINSLCKLFGTGDYTKIPGRQCYALYCFGEHNETIEGLENQYGQRFTITQFSRRYDPQTPSRIMRKQEDLKREILRAQELIKSKRAALKVIKKQYTDWEK